MKTQLYSLILFWLTVTTKLYATVWTVDNNSGVSAQFTNVQSAISASSSGDTIYIQGSLTSYANFTFDKKLYFFGAGYSPLVGNPTTLTNVTGTIGCSGSSFEGFAIKESFSMNDSAISIKNNEFLGLGTNPGGTLNCSFILVAQSSIVINNIFIGNSIISFSGTVLNGIISNNIFNRSICNCNSCGNFGCILYGNSTSGLLITNNLFLNDVGTAPLRFINNCIISNNIFFGTSPCGYSSDLNGNQFSNNIAFGSVNDNIPLGINTGTGNFISVDPLFINVPSGNFNFNIVYDYHLQNNSIGKNAGTDGTDIGIFGGAYPFKNFTGTPSIPFIQEFTIQNPVIGISDPLNVHLKAKKN
jgi:hypothetical protein